MLNYSTIFKFFDASNTCKLSYFCPRRFEVAVSLYIF